MPGAELSVDRACWADAVSLVESAAEPVGVVVVSDALPLLEAESAALVAAAELYVVVLRLHWVRIS